MKEKNKTYKTPLGTFTVKENGTCFIVCDLSKRPYVELYNAYVFEEEGLYGMRSGNTVLCPPVFDKIIKSRNKGAIFLIKGDQMAVFYENGRNYMNEDYDPNNHFIEENYKVGWYRDGKVVIPPIYDNIEFWDYLNIYEVTENNKVRYFAKDGKEVLTFRRDVGAEYNDERFTIESNEKDVLTVLECPPAKDLPEANVLTMKDGIKIGLDRFRFETIKNELINPDDDLPLTESKLSELSNEFSYEFTTYRFTAKGEDPIAEIMDMFDRFEVACNSWFYVIRLTTAPGYDIPADKLLAFTQYIYNQEESVLGLEMAVGHDSNLEPGEVSAFIITHYNEVCFPPSEHFDFIDVCKTGTLDEVIETEKELLKFTRDSIIANYKTDFLQDCYDSVFVNIRFNPDLKRDWKETERILDFIAERSVDFKTLTRNVIEEIVEETNKENENSKNFTREIIEGVIEKYHMEQNDFLSNGIDEMIEDKLKGKVDFLLKYLDWMLRHGAKVNVVKAGQTPLDFVNEKIKTGGQGADDILYKIRDILTQHGAVTYRGLRNKFLKDHTEYEFALHVLANRI